MPKHPCSKSFEDEACEAGIVLSDLCLDQPVSLESDSKHDFPTDLVYGESVPPPLPADLLDELDSGFLSDGIPPSPDGERSEV